MAEKKYNLTEIMAEYGDNDFGFTATDEEEYNSVIAEKEETVDEYKARLHEVEKIILPFLTKLLKTADQPIIKSNKVVLPDPLLPINPTLCPFLISKEILLIKKDCLAP